jgi:hypothetical protein
MGDPNSIIKKIASEFYSFTTHIYSDLKAGKQEAAYRDAIQAEFQLRGYAVQVEVPVTYKYRTTAGTVITVGMGRIDVFARHPVYPVFVVVEVKVLIPFLFKQVASRPVLQLEGYLDTISSNHPNDTILGILVNFPVPPMMTPEWYVRSKLNKVGDNNGRKRRK